MTLERRDGHHPNEFSREIRSIGKGGGTIPPEWKCTVIDLDAIYLQLGEQALAAVIEGRVYAWYKQQPLRVVAIAERKTPTDLQQSWEVTRELARGYGCTGFRVLRRDNGLIDCEVDEDAAAGDPPRRQRHTQYDSTRAFVNAEIRPLFEDWPF